MRVLIALALTAVVGLAWTPGTPIPVVALVPLIVAVCVLAGWVTKGLDK